MGLHQSGKYLIDLNSLGQFWWIVFFFRSFSDVMMVTGWEGIVHTKDHWKVASGCRVRATKSHRGIESEGNAIGGHLATGGSHSEVE